MSPSCSTGTVWIPLASVSCSRWRKRPPRGWWEAYSDVLPEEYAALIGLEAEARAFSTWSIEVIPGLLQTEGYARQVNTGYQIVARVPPGEMERRVQARLKRQQLLTREPPLELSVVLDESALLRQLADRPVMRQQLERRVSSPTSHCACSAGPPVSIVTTSFIPCASRRTGVP